MRQQIEALLRARQYQAVIAEAQHWFANHSNSDPEAFWLAIMACGAAGRMGYWHMAVGWADHAEKICPRMDAEARAWLNFVLGTAVMYTGDLLRSERALRIFCKVASCTPLRNMVPDALCNLGFLMRCKTPRQSGVKFYRKAAAAYAAQGRHPRVIACHLEIAWSQLLDGRADLALREIKAAAALLPQHGDPELTAEAEIVRAFFYQTMGLVPESKALCEQLLLVDDLVRRQKGDIAWLMGRIALKVGDVEGAAEWAEDAEEYVLQDWWPPQLARIQELKDAIEQHSRVGPRMPN